MALTNEGYVPEVYEDIKARMIAKLNTFSTGFDVSPESPDGLLVEIMAFEVAQAYSEIAQVHTSYDPEQSSGHALKSLGLISGHQYGAATRSQADVQLLGTAGIIVPAGSLVADGNGNEFQTEMTAVIPSTVTALASVSGEISLPPASIVNVITSIAGWTGVTQNLAGVSGGLAQTEQQFKNTRDRTVLRNYVGVPEVIEARLTESGVGQVVVLNNTNPVSSLPDGTPPSTIHVTVGEIVAITDEEIALIILNTSGLGCPTFGTTTVTVQDWQGHDHDISFSKATSTAVFIDMDITFLTDNTAGATDGIKAALIDHVNSLLAGEDVIWSRLFGLITPFGKAQINTLTVGRSLGTLAAENLVTTNDEFTNTDVGSINITGV